MSAGHARIAPSSLAMTVVCAASVTLQEAAGVQLDTPEAKEGRAAHLVAMWAAQGRLLNAGERFNSDGREWVVDIDMHNGAKRYAAALGGFHTNLRLEDPVRTSRIHAEHSYGTPDAWRSFSFTAWATAAGAEIAGKFAASKFEYVIRVGDYKYGHRFVEVFENWQLIDYGFGVIERLNLQDEPVLFEFILVQPRSYHRDGPVRIWRVPAIQLRAMLNIAFNKAHEALGPNPGAQTSEQCIDCTARHLCVTFKSAAANLVDFSGSAELQPLDADAMGQELRVLDAAIQRLNGRRTGLAVAVESVLRAGKRVPFYEMTPGQSRLKWREGVTPQEIADFGDLIGINLRKPFDVMTPTQAVEAGIDEKIIKGDYAERPPAGLKLSAVDTTAADKAFAGVTNK